MNTFARTPNLLQAAVLVLAGVAFALTSIELFSGGARRTRDYGLPLLSTALIAGVLADLAGEGRAKRVLHVIHLAGTGFAVLLIFSS